MNTDDLYNTLPSLKQASQQLCSLAGGPEPLLKSLGRLFKHFPQFGICLVHTHCKLEPGEKMVSTGRISEPKVISHEECYPERWLSNGYPYEFSSTPIVEGGSVPQQLLDAFHSQLSSFNGKDLTGLLGICYIHNPDSNTGPEGAKLWEDSIWMEKTEGRTNILEPVSRAKVEKMTNAIPAAWYIFPRNKDELNGPGDIIVSAGCVCLDESASVHVAGVRSAAPGPDDCIHMFKRVLFTKEFGVAV